MKFLIFVLATFIISLPLLARGGGSVISGGGNGVVIGKSVYLLDLVEHGNERHPFILGAPTYAVTGDLLDAKGLLLSDFEQKLLNDKIADIALLDPILAMAVQKTISGLNWALEDAPLKPIDPDTQILVKWIQLATRTGNQVLIRRVYWQAMDSANRVALLIHETLAALADPALTAAQPIRSITAKIFDNTSYRDHLDVRYDLAYLPSITALKRQLSVTTPVLVNNREIGDLRFVDGPWADTSGLNPVSELQFQPSLRLSWSDGSSSTVTSFDPQTCHMPAQGRHLTSLDAEFYSIEARLNTDLHEGAPLPRYVWKAVARQRTHIRFNDPSTSDTIAACSADNRAQIDFLNQWLAQFDAFDRGSPKPAK